MRTGRWRLVGSGLCLVLLLAAPASAKSYSADRFDAVIRLLPDGILDVTETVTFRFEDGTFREVYREIPTRNTDGIEVVRAEMQGRLLPFGTETGTVEVQQRNSRVGITWRFRPIEGATREFVLQYRVRGAVRQQATADLLAWRALPREHRYHIATSTIRFDLPVAPIGQPEVSSRRAEAPHVRVDGDTVQIETSSIRTNGWVEVTFRFKRGTAIAVPPAWQQHAAQIAARSPIWIGSALIIVTAGLIVLVVWRLGYDAPASRHEHGSDASQTVAPDDMAPAVAGVLVSNGRSGIEHAMAAICSLADRGELVITTLPSGVLGQRDFLLTRQRGTNLPLARYEEAALETIFKGTATPGGTVKLSQARSRLMHQSRPFACAMLDELRSHGFVDEYRKELRDRYNRASIWLLVAGLIAVAPAVLLLREHGAWPLLIAAALLVLALVAAGFAAATTPLSNNALGRARRWQAYRSHLQQVARGKVPLGHAPLTVLSTAMALGLAAAWAKYLKQWPYSVPSWFQAMHESDARSAFPAFLATGGAGHVATVGGGGAGIAGGGASGAR